MEKNHHQHGGNYIATTWCSPGPGISLLHIDGFVNLTWAISNILSAYVF